MVKVKTAKDPGQECLELMGKLLRQIAKNRKIVDEIIEIVKTAQSLRKGDAL